MTKTYSKINESVEYSGEDRRVWRDGDHVYKVDPIRLGAEWRNKVQQIQCYWYLPGFVDFTEDGYVMKYIDGTDLHGNVPFCMDGSSLDVVIESPLKYEVTSIFGDAIKVGKELGYTFGDITCGNIMTDGEQLYMIDYEVITPWPLNASYLCIWDNTLKKVFGEN